MCEVNSHASRYEPRKIGNECSDSMQEGKTLLPVGGN